MDQIINGMDGFAELIRMEGGQAAVNGESMSSCPYDEEHPKARKLWTEGWSVVRVEQAN